MPIDRSLCSGNDGIVNARLTPSPLLYKLLEKETQWHDRISHVIHYQQSDAIDSVNRLGTCQDRDEMVRNIVVVLCTKSNMGGDTGALAVGLLDTMLANTNIQYKYMAVCALTCVYIAAKMCEEEFDMSIDDLLDVVGLSYSQEEVIRMERCVLHKCGWDVGLPTSHRFVQLMISLCACSAAERISLEPKLRPAMLSALADHEIVYTYLPSCIALACLVHGLRSVVDSSSPSSAQCNNTVTWLASITKTNMADVDHLCSLLSTMSSPPAPCASPPSHRAGRCARKRRRRLNSSGNIQSTSVSGSLRWSGKTKCHYSKKQRAVGRMVDADWLEYDWTPALHLLLGQ